ncbi:response regulator transcription factor [Rubellimicrobium roseum]|uniref:Response regulator transcription factor n=1 Tax=Rubellimicrobium roseum TaxID=687525 RepID=A0A5C4NBQ5_9RHOB|nr:response regulator transcription factor [Rubellimicrobium roseum]TNC72171.1 response regulator transcription factor [Rubellimicrobium roseum]
MRILLVEDNPGLAEAIGSLLSGAGHAVDTVGDGLAAEALTRAERFDLVILDLGLPEMDGLSVLRALRARRDDAAVLILTARGAPEERVRGLDLGADDYLVKPFDAGELEARVRSLLRRRAGIRAAEVRLGEITFDLARRRVLAEGKPLDLPARELALFELLVMRQGQVVTKEAIQQALTPLDELLSDNAVEQYASRLRRRLAPHGLALRTARGIGYFLEPTDEA